ncbi:MAG: hypothetical protein QOG42_1115 [Solirubrobacteraceae bacterium]|nr:hypothetical protein [Solirubrobacteraceae bacterium]
MSNLDTRKAGGGQTVSFANVRLESQHLLPEELVDLLAETTDDHPEVDVQVKQRGTGPAAH